MNSLHRKTKLAGRILLFNQATGVLFRQLAEDIAATTPPECILYTGNADEVRPAIRPDSELRVVKAPYYNRSSKLFKAISWLRYTLGAGLRITFARRTDFLLIVSNPPILALWLWVIARFRSLNYGMLVYDIYPDVVVEAGMLKRDHLLARLWTSMNRQVYRNSKLIVTLGNRMAERLQKQIDAEMDIHVIPPWVETAEIKPIPLEANHLATQWVPVGKRVVLYAGNMGASHDIVSIVHAAEHLQDREDIYFLLVGGGEKFRWSQSYVAKHQLRNVKVASYVPEDQFPQLLALADISITTQESGLEEVMVPSKTMFYLAAGSALLAICNRPSELSDIVDRAEIGTVVKPGQPEELAAEITRLLSNPEKLALMKDNARRLAMQSYSRQQLCQQFVALLNATMLRSFSNDRRH